MKLWIFVLMLPGTLAIPGLSSVQIWLASFQEPLLSIIDNPFRKSTIPRFILDARHPWILENQRKLEALPNLAGFLCANSSSQTDVKPVENGLQIPDDLFAKLVINNGLSRPGWPNALERIQGIKKCPRAMEEAKTLHVGIYAHEFRHTGDWISYLEPFQPPANLFTLFSEVLGSMKSLETLYWRVPEDQPSLFEKAFSTRNLTLSSIKHLMLAPTNHYLVPLCPNLEVLESRSEIDWTHESRDRAAKLIQDTTGMYKLKRFVMESGSRGWNPLLAAEIVKAMSGIESLGMLGSVGTNGDCLGYYTGDNGKLTEVLDVLRKLKNLVHLDLPESSSLCVGFDGGPWCGNAYDGPNGWRVARRVSQYWAEAVDRASNIVIESLPHLRSFTIGGSEPNITRTEEGITEARWPWTGRMAEWLDEVEPKPPGYEDVEYDEMSDKPER